MASEQLTSKLSLFQKRPAMLSVLNTVDEAYESKTSLGDGTNVVAFTVPSSPTLYTDLYETLLYLRVKIVNEDGTDIGAAAQVAPVNNALGSLIKDCEMFINDVRVSTTFDNYALSNFLEAFMGNTEAKVMEECQGYSEDSLTEPGSMNSTDTTNAGGNLGLRRRATWFARSREVELVGKISSPANTSLKLWLPNLTFDYRFTLNSPDFVLMFPQAVGDPRYRMKVTKATMLVRRVAVAPGVVTAHSALLAEQPARYQVRRYSLSSFTVPANQLSFNKTGLFMTDAMPNQIFLMMTGNRNWLGNAERNPWYFQHYNLSSLSLRMGELNIPNQPVTLNMGGQIFKRMYLETLRGMGAWSDGSCPANFSAEAFRESMFLCCLDLTRDKNVDAAYVNSQYDRRSLQLDAVLRQPTAEGIVVLVLGVFDGTIFVNNHFVPSTDY